MTVTSVQRSCKRPGELPEEVCLSDSSCITHSVLLTRSETAIAGTLARPVPMSVKGLSFCYSDSDVLPSAVLLKMQPLKSVHVTARIVPTIFKAKWVGNLYGFRDTSIT